MTWTSPGEELWRFPRSEEACARRLLVLGEHGVGGFVKLGWDQDGVWLLRRVTERSLRERLAERSAPWPWRAAVELTIAIARALAYCEAQALAPGPILPSGIALEPSDAFAFLSAEPLIRALAGAPLDASALVEPVPPRWLPPEQAAGALWDSAANRYLLGVLLYRLCAGQDPFAGGLRAGFEDKSARGAPPFDAAVARALPPGLHGFCLRLLAAERAERPGSATAIVERLGELLAEGPSSRSAGERRPSVSFRQSEPSTPGAISSARAHGTERGGRVAVALATFSAVAATSVVLTTRAPLETRAGAAVGVEQPLNVAATTSRDCASCHPRQSAEWRRSVMAYAAKSPLFQALEMLIEEQVGREHSCPNGAGVLRGAEPARGCRDRVTGELVTGSGGELWCVNCHAPGENLGRTLPAWDATSFEPASRRPLVELLPEPAMDGIGCAFCHQTAGPAHPPAGALSAFQGNPSWRSSASGRVFTMRPEEARGLFGIANSGYALAPERFLSTGDAVHARSPPEAVSYRSSSEFCGACHDVRLFGTDVLGRSRGEHFKRLRNAYSEWVDWAAEQRGRGEPVATCQGCHMSTYPGVCVNDSDVQFAAADQAFTRLCPKGTRFVPRAPGALASGLSAVTSERPSALHAHYFSGVDLPLSPGFDTELLDDATLDISGTPLGARQRRDLLLASSVRLAIDEPAMSRAGLFELPVRVVNVGAGHRVPAGFSQERELWLHVRVSDARDRTLYEVGRVERGDQDLADKVFLRVNVDDAALDARGRPLGLFGADVLDGPDVPEWTRAADGASGREFRGRGLVNFQNGFLRCVRCVGQIDVEGRCQPLPGQARTRAARYADGDYDSDSGECRSNLSGMNALFETYFPVGALDATRGIAKAPDAIIDTRSLAPNTPETFRYELALGRVSGPLSVTVRLLFRAFPPYLLRAFAAYERRRAEQGARPSGPLIDGRALERLEVVELARAERIVE